jgi:iron complex outermembrane receptor protein
MNTTKLLRMWTGCRRPLALALSAFAAQAAFAQTPASGGNDQPLKLETYRVTGSYLPVSATVNASPVVTIESSDIGQSGATDPLRLLRQLTPFFAGSGNLGTEANNGYAGESNVALRNLTTLVLLNGQRMAYSPFSSTNGGAPGVDLNTIPTAMIDRIEILKDGASTVYGTDAIGGVVNVILKKDFNGFEAGVRYGSTKNGDYKTRETYIMGGASGEGYSLTVAAQHFENIPLLTTSRPLTTLTGVQINALGFNPTSAVFSGSYPGRVGSDILAGSTLIATGAAGFNAAITSPGIKSSPTDTSVTGGFTGAAALNYLVANGTYLVAANTPAGQAVGGSATALNTTLFGNPLIENTKRNQFVANGSKELLGKNLVVFSDFLFSQTTNGGSGLAPAPIAGVGPGGLNTLFIPANNPYNVFNVDFPGPLAARTRLIELGKRYSINETNTWRFVGGLKGQINDQYSWEATYNYSRASQLSRTFGGANGAAMNAAMIPLLSAAGGYVYNAAGKPLSTLTDASGNHLPVYNYFALPGFNDPATLDAIRTTLFKSGDSSLRNIQAVLNGKPFELPAGDVSFALGVEDRTEDITASVDGLYASGLALGFNPAKTFTGGTRSSKGAFLEVGMPVTSAKQNIPGFHVLDLNLADRYEKIQPGGNANSPKIGVRWLPVDDSFVIRGTYTNGFIAPSIFSLFGPASGNSPAFQVLQGNGSAGSGGSLGNLITIQGSANQLSNPNLPASKSKSYTAGFVYSPKQVKGLSFTVDYYRISQDKVGSIDYTAIAADLNAKGSGSVYAAGFVFANGTTLASTAPNQVTSTNFGSITVSGNPAGDQWTNGLDLNVDYKFDTGSYGRFAVGASANILFNYMFRATPEAPYLQYARNYSDTTNGGGGVNGLLPSYIIKPYISNSYGPLASSLFLNYVAPTPTTGGPGFTTGSVDPDTLSGKPYTIPGYFTTDVAFTYTVPNHGHDWARNLSVTVGANNLFNKQAPYVPVDGNPPGENNTVESQYDIIGRFLFVEIKKGF